MLRLKCCMTLRVQSGTLWHARSCFFRGNHWKGGRVELLLFSVTMGGPASWVYAWFYASSSRQLSRLGVAGITRFLVHPFCPWLRHRCVQLEHPFCPWLRHRCVQLELVYRHAIAYAITQHLSLNDASLQIGITAYCLLLLVLKPEQLHTVGQYHVILDP